MPVILEEEKIKELRKAGQLDRREARELLREEKPKPKQPTETDILLSRLKELVEVSEKGVSQDREFKMLLIQLIESLRDRPVVVNVPESETNKWQEIEAFKRNDRWIVRKVK